MPPRGVYPFHATLMNRSALLADQGGLDRIACEPGRFTAFPKFSGRWASSRCEMVENLTSNLKTIYKKWLNILIDLYKKIGDVPSVI